VTPWQFQNNMQVLFMLKAGENEWQNGQQGDEGVIHLHFVRGKIGNDGGGLRGQGFRVGGDCSAICGYGGVCAEVGRRSLTGR